MRRVLVLCLVACSTPSSEPPRSSGPGAATAAAAATAPATAAAVAVSDAASAPLWFGARAAPAELAPAPPTPTRLWNGRHGVAIAAVFATDDGSAVVSIDESNHARLWPALDGTREPLVLPLTQPRQVVVARDGDAFALAALDVSGGLEILTIDAAGLLTKHIKRAPEPGVDTVVAHDRGFLALHRDQTLELLDLRGDRRGALLPAKGEYVLKLLARNGRTLAIVRAREGVRGRWLATDKLAWAEQTPKLKINLERVFLSPDHRKLLTFDTFEGLAHMVDLATGRAREFASAATTQEGAMPVGFAADGHAVFSLNDFELSTLTWWSPAQHKVAVLGGSTYALEFVSVEAPVVTSSNVISFSGTELAIARRNTLRSPSEVKFLGYRTPRAKRLATSPLGVVASIGSAVGLLDADARVERRVPAPHMIPLANDLALVQFVAPRNETATELTTIDPEWIEGTPDRRRPKPVTPRLALYDFTAKRDVQTFPSAPAFHFEAATQLLAIDRRSRVELATFDPVTRTFGALHTIAGPVTRVALLDPALSDGVAALLIREAGATVEVRAVAGFDAGPPRRFAGTLDAVDRAGRLYLRRDADTVVVERHNHEPVRLAIEARSKLRPSPTGNEIVVVARNGLSLLDASGATVWSAGFPDITDAAWTPAGELYVAGGDVARLDVTTGRVVAAQCGWGFAVRARRPEPVDFPTTKETTCDH